jgi:hypothetical protein
MNCRYCGLDTGSGAGHRSQAECIQALSEEIDRAKRLISHVREANPDHRGEAHHEAPDVPQPTSQSPGAHLG